MRLKKEKSRHQAGSKVRFDMSGKNQKRRKIEYCVREQRGTTLVELIVTFALIGLFMAAASVMMTTSLRLFTRMQATSRAVTVSDMILDKVAGEISAAVLPVGSPGADDYYFWLESSENGNWVAFKNRLGSPVAIFAAPRDGAAGNADAGAIGSGELFVRYYELVNGEHVLRKQPEVDWRYDDQVYMGYRITKLSFSQADRGEKPGVIKIDLTLKHEATGFEYSAYRFARVYNAAYTTGDYLGERNEFEPGNSGLPGKEEDFEIKEKDEPGGGEGEKEKNTFHVLHMYGSTLLLEEDYSGVPGTVVTIYAKPSSYPGFENYVPKEESRDIVVDAPGIVRTYILEYDLKKEEEPYTVYFVSKRTGKELGRKVYTDVELNKPFGITLPYIAGYKTPSPEWQEIVFTDTVKSYTFYYEPKLWQYTVHFWTRGNESLLPDQTGEIYTDESIQVEAPVIPGYVSEFRTYTFTAVGDDTGGNIFTIYYDVKKGDSLHPFVTDGNDITVKENDKAANWPWPQIAEKVKSFFNSLWHKVEWGDKTGYYQTFVYKGQEFVIGGWEDAKGQLKEFEEAVRADSGNPDCEIMVINSEASNREVMRALLLSCAEEVGAWESDLEFIRNSHIKVEFDDGINLEKIKIEQRSDSKKEIEIEYDD